MLGGWAYMVLVLQKKVVKVVAKPFLIDLLVVVKVTKIWM